MNPHVRDRPLPALDASAGCAIPGHAQHSPYGMTRRGALVLVAGLALQASQVGRAAATGPSPTTTSTPSARPGRVWVGGDSIAVVGQSALELELASRVNKLEVDAVCGRPVAALNDLVRKRLVQGSRPDVMVLALGTNPSPGWCRNDFERVTDLIPDGTAVVLVTAYRSQVTSLPTTCLTMGSYSRSVQDVASLRDNVSVAAWRAAASRHPRLLADGVHPNARGAQVWARLVADAVDRSWARTSP